MLVTSAVELSDIQDMKGGMMEKFPITPKDHGYSRHAVHFGDYQIENARASLAEVEYDTMVGTGLSGSLVVPRLAIALGKDWAVVRKQNDSPHRSREIEGTYFGERWLFVDDFIESGDTEATVIKAVDKLAELYDITLTYVGSYQYAFNVVSHKRRESLVNFGDHYDDHLNNDESDDIFYGKAWGL